MKVHHIGYLVNDINAARLLFEQLGYKVAQPPYFDPLRKLTICFLTSVNGVQVELVVPEEGCTCIGKGLRKIGCAPYHICYEVHDLTARQKELEKSGYTVIQHAMPAPAIGGRSVAFLYHSDLGLIELVEEK